jgi:methyl-accepting chemotaxis protein
MKKIGIILLFAVLGLSAYLIFWSRFEAGKINQFVTIWIIISVFFYLSERITSITLFGKFKAEMEKARSDAKEIEEILASIKSQKEMIDLIARDANTAQKQMLQIETIANEADVKVQKIEKILKDVEAKEMTKKLKRLSATGRMD